MRRPSHHRVHASLVDLSQTAARSGDEDGTLTGGGDHARTTVKRGDSSQQPCTVIERPYLVDRRRMPAPCPVSEPGHADDAIAASANPSNWIH
jgi:hypothetical protein